MSMPSWLKWGMLGSWVVGGVAFTILAEHDDDFEERTVESARVTVTAHPEDGEELPKALRLELEAEIAEGGDLLRIVLEAGDVRGANPSGPEVEMVLADRRDVYLDPLTDKPRLPRGKTWIHMDVEQVQSTAPEFSGVLSLVGADGLLTSKPAFDDEYEAGTETIDGVETTRYELSAEADELDDLPSFAEGMLVGDEVRMTAWMDEQGFVRRLVVPMSAAYLAPRAGEGTVELRYDVYDLGADVTIELPDEQDVVSG